ncbi:muskelin-like isoform X2 [Watersipora subatra]|uniref:muskelin-like isoform X2 n=1 Tax=Watersipora subatra TaxID=2589382 RepID=UPI00355BBDF0
MERKTVIEATLALSEPNILDYTVTKWSSFSSSYTPSNILKDCPADQSSRWSSESNIPPQYLMLKLEKMSVLASIKFGKFEKTHVCNLKRFKVYAGLTEDNLIEILESGLQNDHVPETFEVKNKADSCYLPVNYVKIVPLQSWGTSFNFSIWYIQLKGIDNRDLLSSTVDMYKQHRERLAIRLCLKHFRQQNYLDAFEILQKRTKVSLEDPLLEELYNTLVRDGDYEQTENLVIKAGQNGLFSHFVNSQELESKWSKIEPVNRDGSDQRPGRRGGHQMVINPYSETLYLFGGWDGHSNLADFWAYHVPSQLWTCISSNTEEDGGPSSRSCHKMIMDYERRHIFVLGRYLDVQYRSPTALKSSFYVYDIDQNKWIRITDDTFSMGGPRLIFDHQMCMDIENQTIYVFGGKIQCINEVSTCSGLFSYHIPTNHWRLLREDSAAMKSRFGHSMMFDNRTRKLYVFAGQRGRDSLNDLLVYDVDNDTVQTLPGIDHSLSEGHPEPPSGFTQRATIDADEGVIHLLLSMNRQMKEKDKEPLKNILWLYKLSTGSWSTVANDTTVHSISQTFTADTSTEPIPRFAHQLVYDHVKKVHYMFGGNPRGPHKSSRLDDFWMLRLFRPSQEHFVRQSTSTTELQL